MDCPVCQTHRLKGVESEPQLRTLQCDGCGGHWLQSYHYWTWRETLHPTHENRPAAPDGDLTPLDNAKAKICIECGRVMSRFRVGKGMEFYLDRCGACGGIWFDRNEWEILKQKNLHDEIHKIFARPWQLEIVRVQYDDRLEKTVGPEKYRDVKALKAWLDRDPNRAQILAYLERKDP